MRTFNQDVRSTTYYIFKSKSNEDTSKLILNISHFKDSCILFTKHAADNIIIQQFILLQEELEFLKKIYRVPLKMFCAKKRFFGIYKYPDFQKIILNNQS